MNGALRIRPNPRDYYNRGAARLLKSDYRAAVADLSDSIRLDPSYDAAYLLRGTALQSEGAMEAALTDYDQAIRLGSKRPDVYLSRAIIWRAKGDLERAIPDFDEARRLDPERFLEWLQRDRESLAGYKEVPPWWERWVRLYPS